MKKATIQELIKIGEEKQWLEYKRSVNWSTYKPKIAKSILAFSNLEGGGYIIIGMEEKNGSWIPKGMITNDYDSYNSDHVKDYVATFADPYVKFELNIL